MSQDNTSTTTLNTLIGTLLDSIEGYQKSAEDVDNPQLEQRFQARARERQQAVATLQAAVARLGGNPEDDSTLLGGAHRVFLDLKAAVTGRDDQAILNEVERGEDYLKGKFEAAIRNVDLAPEARTAVEEAWNTVKAGHDEMSRLKHEWQGYRKGQADARQESYAREQEYAAQNRSTVAPGDPGSAPPPYDPSMTTTDTYQQAGGGYPGTISPNDGSGSTVGGRNTR